MTTAIRNLPFGVPWYLAPSGAGLTTFGLDASDDALEFILQVEEAFTAVDVGFRYGTRTGTPPTYRISLQGVSNGRADGTILASGSAYVDFTPPANGTWDNTFRWLTLTAAPDLTRGQKVAVVIAYQSGTVSGAHFSSFARSTSLFPSSIAFPCAVQVNGGVATRAAAWPVVGLRTSGAARTYGYPLLSVSSTQFSSDSSPSERGIKFTTDADQFSTFAVVGVEFQGRTPAAAKSFVITLYDGTTPLQTVTVDSDDLGSNAAAQSLFRIFFDETTLSVLNAGTPYYIGLNPRETGANLAIDTLQVAAASDLDAFPMGQGWIGVTRTGDPPSGAWTEVTTDRPLIVPIVAAITKGVGGVGFLVNGGLAR